MSTISTTREFVPGTTGWTADDLDDPEIERLWNAGKYEIVEGVLTLMPPAWFDGSAPLYSLVRLIDRHIEVHGPKGRFAPEADLIVNRKRVALPDFVFLTEADMKQQRERRLPKNRPMVKYGRLRIAPTLIIESLSVGHEDHDRETKRTWYAEAGVQNYWLLNAFTQSLECLKLVKADYKRDAWGREKDVVKPSLFPGLIIPLGNLWV